METHPSQDHDDPPAADAIPRRIGRMLVLSKLGEGGMGVVFAAYDPDLDRKVAVKMLHPDLVGGAEARTRLLREAQALARLAHPNIVAVHDVGTTGRSVWIGMEFVQGRTVATWLAERARGWREVVEVFVQAARGVEAAHKAGLLHRDLKPANIMIGDDGRVRVMDFGLVRCGADIDDSKCGELTQGLLTGDLTRTGAVLGTPAYMSPEQFLGHVADERSDQFSLCVTLWEALYGRHPFSDTSMASLALAQLPEPEFTSTRVPRWLRRVVLQGLAARRESRFASVTELRRAIEANPTTHRWAGGLTLIAALAAGGWFGASKIRHERAMASCHHEGATIDVVWNDNARDRVRKGLVRTGVKFAATTAERAIPWLDDYATQWNLIRVDRCVAGIETGTVNQASEICLEEAYQQFSTLVDEFVRDHPQADGEVVVQRAVSAASALPSLAVCQDDARLRTRNYPSRDTESWPEIQRIRGMTHHAAVLTWLTRYEEATRIMQDAFVAAEALGWSPLRARVMVQLGDLLARTSKYAEAEQLVEDAYFMAGAAGEEDVQYEAAESLIHIVGVGGTRFAEGLLWGQMAKMLLERAHVPAADPRRSSLLGHLGQLHESVGSDSEAVALLERSLAIQEEFQGSLHPNLIPTLNILASAQTDAGNPERALALLDRALQLTDSALGTEHPYVARTMINLGNAYYKTGDYERPIVLYQKAAVLYGRLHGPKSSDVAWALGNLAVLYDETGRHKDALDMQKQVLEIYRALFGAEHPKCGISIHNLGTTYHALGDYTTARSHLEAALAIFTRELGPTNELTGIGMARLADTLSELGEQENALDLQMQALSIYEKTLPADDLEIALVHIGRGSALLRQGERDRARVYYAEAQTLLEGKSLQHPKLSRALTGLGAIHVEQGEMELAKPLLERSLSIHEHYDNDVAGRAATRFLLARALWHAPELRVEALAQARRARDEFERAGVGFMSKVDDVDMWLRQPNG